MAESGRWGHRPRRAAAVHVPTNGLHGESKFYFKQFLRNPLAKKKENHFILMQLKN